MSGSDGTKQHFEEQIYNKHIKTPNPVSKKNREKKNTALSLALEEITTLCQGLQEKKNKSVIDEMKSATSIMKRQISYCVMYFEESVVWNGSRHTKEKIHHEHDDITYMAEHTIIELCGSVRFRDACRREI